VVGVVVVGVVVVDDEVLVVDDEDVVVGVLVVVVEEVVVLVVLTQSRPDCSATRLAASVRLVFSPGSTEEGRPLTTSCRRADASDAAAQSPAATAISTSLRAEFMVLDCDWLSVPLAPVEPQPARTNAKETSKAAVIGVHILCILIAL